ncbi:hypothetical protein [Spirosoma aerophilum]
MSEPIQFSLINGRFSPEEVVPILTGMTNAKLQHHSRKIALHKTEEDIKASEKRQKQLEADLRRVLTFLHEAVQRGSRVDIEGMISIVEVPVDVQKPLDQ